jgi:hypothetical protein
MQDKYVGDIGDFGKYGLLRHLGALGTLGVVWYLVPNEAQNNDGRHLRYLNLDDSTCACYGLTPCTRNEKQRNERELRACDPELYDSLRDLVIARRRAVAEIAARRILPTAKVFVEEATPPIRGRDAWLTRTLNRTRDVDIVFLDPDNGLKARGGPRTSRLSPKYAFYEEVRQFAERSQSLVLYQHFDRASNFVTRRRDALAEALNIRAEQIHALHYGRGTARVFFVIPALKHEDVMRERVATFLSGPWQIHFPVV